jgi:Putative ABC-transporter type IV
VITDDVVVSTWLFASVGVSLEVAFTATATLRARDPGLRGHSYLWMFPIYGLVYPLFAWSWPLVGGWPVVLRCALYVLAAYVVEYTSGWLLRRATGSCPWEVSYRASPWGVHGLIRLDYAPLWLGVALLFERLYRVLAV